MAFCVAIAYIFVCLHTTRSSVEAQSHTYIWYGHPFDQESTGGEHDQFSHTLTYHRIRMHKSSTVRLVPFSLSISSSLYLFLSLSISISLYIVYIHIGKFVLHQHTCSMFMVYVLPIHPSSSQYYAINIQPLEVRSGQMQGRENMFRIVINPKRPN